MRSKGPQGACSVRRLLQQHVVIDIQNARGVIGAFHIAADPDSESAMRETHHTCPGDPRILCCRRPGMEFTTREPADSATRVSPPGTMVTFSPS